MIYFDNSATTQIWPEVLDTYNQVCQKIWGIPPVCIRLVRRLGIFKSRHVNRLRTCLTFCQVRLFLPVVVQRATTGSLKERQLKSVNMANILLRPALSIFAVRNSMERLADLGFEITYLPVDDQGRIDPEDVRKALRPDTILVESMVVNNEIGTIQPIKEIGEILKDYPKVHFMVDAVQAIGKGIDDLVFSDRVDFAVFSGHKFHAPRGTGFVYAKAGRKLAPLIDGGGQERGRRNGTENTAGFVAMAKALRLVKQNEKQAVEREKAVKTRIYDHIKNFEHVEVISQNDDSFAPHILTFAIVGVRGETIVHAFEDHDIYISTTSACSSKKHVEAGTLAAMKVPDEIATSAVRISLGDQNTLAEADEFNRVFDELYAGFKKIID